jgi:hypothetical protein
MTTNKAFLVVLALVLWFIGSENGRADSSTSHFLVPVAGQFPTLTVNGITNGQVYFNLSCEPGIPHIIESSSNMVNWAAVVTNSDNSSNRLIALDASADGNFYRVWRNPIPLFAYALAAVSDIEMNGNGQASDSWNSHDPDQSLNGLYNGYFGTNGDMAVANGLLDLGNHIVNGDIYLGSDASAVIGGSAGGATGTIYQNRFILFPNPVLPTKDANENTIVWSPAPGTPVSHSFTNNGYYIVNDNGSLSVEYGAKIILQVNVTNYFPSAITIKGGTTNAGTIVIYQTSGSATLGKAATGGAINSRPENFIYFGLSGVSDITLGSGSTFVGTVYAPSASSIFLSGGGGMNFVGSCIVSNALVFGHINFHYDTSLKTNGPGR